MSCSRLRASRVAQGSWRPGGMRARQVNKTREASRWDVPRSNRDSSEREGTSPNEGIEKWN